MKPQTKDMDTVPRREKHEAGEKEQAKQKDPAEEKTKRQSTRSPPPTMGCPPPSFSSNQPITHNDEDDSDSPPHSIDSPTNSSLCSDHSSISRLSSPRDQAPPANPPAERNPHSPSLLAAVVSVKRSVRDGPPSAAAVVAKVGTATVDRPAVRHWAVEAPATTMAAGGGGGGGGGVRKLRADLSILVARVCGCVFCLVAFSTMVADKDQGWALDSFYRYKEFRFCLAVDAIGFVYSGLQAYGLVCISARGKHLAQHHLRPYLNFSLDQILSYLLILTTSSAVA